MTDFGKLVEEETYTPDEIPIPSPLEVPEPEAEPVEEPALV